MERRRRRGAADEGTKVAMEKEDAERARGKGSNAIEKMLSEG